MVRNEKIQILKLLIEHKEKPFTIREISQRRNINYKSAYEAIGKLHKEQAIQVQKVGNTKLCTFNNKFTHTTFLAEKQRLQHLLKNTDINVIYKELTNIPEQFIALVFGSTITNTQTPQSDIDLLIISHAQERIEKALSWTPINLHLTHITPEEFISMLLTKEFSVVHEANKNNVILVGTEEYYRFIEYVQKRHH